MHAAMAHYSAEELQRAANSLTEEERKRVESALTAAASPQDQPISIAAAEEDRRSFVTFIKRATSDRASHEYTELYHFLLKCFNVADKDFDGRVRRGEFDAMVELAANLPRRFGFAPTVAEMYSSTEERIKARGELFDTIDAKCQKNGFISFDEWMSYIYPHICEKAATLDEQDAVSKMERSKEDFKNFIIEACRSRTSKEYKELYSFLLQCFTTADTDGTGKIGPDKFDTLIDVAADAPRRFGFAPPAAETFKTTAEKFAARKTMFEIMDTDHHGFISFEEWLTFSYRHICEKAKTLDSSLSGEMPPVPQGGFAASGAPTKAAEVPQPTVTKGRCPFSGQSGSCPFTGQSGESGMAAAEKTREGFVTFIKKATTCQLSYEYRELYQFLLKSFTAADSDFDGKVRRDDFDAMVEVAASLPRRFGFAPSVTELYKTPEDRIKARTDLFDKIDVLKSGFISFDHWMGYIYPHICEKAASLDAEKAQSKMERSQEDFKTFIVEACKSRATLEYKELYSFLLNCFTEADTDCDGKINFETFDTLVDVAAAAPRRFGFAPSSDSTYSSADARLAARKVMFEEMDTDKTGFISFEESLNYFYKHICAKAKTLDDSLSGLPPPAASIVES